MPKRRLYFASIITALFFYNATVSAGPDDRPVYTSTVPFPVVENHLINAIKANKMGLVSKASATHGAASIGVTIKGNRVFGVYHPRFAVRMLKASVAAGIEAPIRIYLYENDDGTATLTYKKPSAVFKPYGSTELDTMAAELDAKRRFHDK